MKGKIYLKFCKLHPFFVWKLIRDLVRRGDCECRNFRAGIKFGRGVYTIPDFGVYEGTFEQGQLNGEGTLKLESGDSYRG